MTKMSIRFYNDYEVNELFGKGRILNDIHTQY